MKIFRDVMVAVLSSSIGVSLNSTPHRWLVVPLITIVIIYFTASFSDALISALSAGLLCDAFALSIGPYTIIFCLVILAVHYSTKVLTFTQPVIRTIAGVLTGVLVFYLLYIVMQSMRIGVNYGFSIIVTPWLLLCYILTSSAIIFAALICIRFMKFILADYAR